MTQIHPSAIVSPEAEIGSDVQIGPYAIVEADARVGDGSTIESHAILRSGSRIGKSVTVGNFAVIGGLPQDLKFDPKVRTYAEIGDNSTLREGVTINRSTREGQSTSVGANAFLMANSHVGHDCRVGTNVVLANGALLAGHVEVGSFSFVGGNAAIHQFCRLGEGVMCGGMAAVSMDVAPFTMVSERDALFGLNIVGLRRRGVDKESIAVLQTLYRKLFGLAGNLRETARSLSDENAAVPEAVRFLAFFEGGKRGFARPGRRK